MSKKSNLNCGSPICKINSFLNIKTISDLFTYYVRYIGNIQYKTPLGNLNPSQKDYLIRESIKRVCTLTDNAPVNEFTKHFSENPSRENLIVSMSVSSCNISIVNANTGNVLIAFDLPQISFVGHGDLKNCNYFVIAASDYNKTRAFYVLEAIYNFVLDITQTINDAFRINHQVNEEHYTELPTSSFIEEDNVCDNDEVSTFISINDKNIHNESWYHGVMNRKTAEKLLGDDGDFLVRKSEVANGTFVLSVVVGDEKVHLLLNQCNGILRLKCYDYSSVTHLVKFHNLNLVPIFSQNYKILLKKPINNIKKMYIIEV